MTDQIHVNTDDSVDDMEKNLHSHGIEDNVRMLFTGDTNVDKLFQEYIQESIHGGWEGFNSRDLKAVHAFLKDVATYKVNLS